MLLTRGQHDNSDQSNLATGGIAVARPTSSSFVFDRWQHKTDVFDAICFAWRPTPIATFPEGQGPHLAQYVVGPHKCTCQTASKSVERSKQRARVWRTTDDKQTDRQTDHATEKCVGIGGIVCARAIPRGGSRKN